MIMDTEGDNETIGQAREEASQDIESGETIHQRLRRKRRQITERNTVDFDVPGYGGDLVVRYRKVPWDDLKKITLKVEKSRNPRKELIAQADILIRCCDSIWVRQDGELEALLPEEADPVRFDDRLAEFFQMEAKAARHVVFELFNNDLAVTYQHNELMEWAATSDGDDDEEFLGE